MSTPETKTKILISISIKCYNDLLQHGAQAVLEREYGSYITATEAGYDFSLLIDLENLPADAGPPPRPTLPPSLPPSLLRLTGQQKPAKT